MTKNTRDVLISLLALAVIVLGIRYHVMRQRLRHADLHAWYQQDNAELFGACFQYHQTDKRQHSMKSSNCSQAAVRTISRSISCFSQQLASCAAKGSAW